MYICACYLDRKNDKPDLEMLSLIQLEKDEYLQSFGELEDQMMTQLVPRDVDDGKGVVVEVRAGTGE